jgi:hypothetical protein
MPISPELEERISAAWYDSIPEASLHRLHHVEKQSKSRFSGLHCRGGL